MGLGKSKYREGVKHPAKFSDSILVELDKLLGEYGVDSGMILDPFAGTGKVMELGQGRPDFMFALVELEEEWAEEAKNRRDHLGAAARVLATDFLKIGRHWADDEKPRFDACITSPVYGNRMSDHHIVSPADNSTQGRNTYTHKLGRQLSPGNSGAMRFDSVEYKTLHLEAYRLIFHLLRPGGLFFLNVSDFIANWNVVRACQWHAMAAKGAGFELSRMVNVDTPRNRQGENGGLRVDGERIYVFSKPARGLSTWQPEDEFDDAGVAKVLVPA